MAQHSQKNHIRTQLSWQQYERAQPLETREHAVCYFETFAVKQADVLPRRVPGFKNPDLLLLPCGFTKTMIHAKYCSGVPKQHLLPYSSFTELWKEVQPNTCIQKPRSDLCSSCTIDTMALSKLRSHDTKRNVVQVLRLISWPFPRSGYFSVVFWI